MRENMLLAKAKKIIDGTWVTGYYYERTKYAYVNGVKTPRKIYMMIDSIGDSKWQVDPETVCECTGKTLECCKETNPTDKLAFEGDKIGVYSLKWNDDGERERDELVAIGIVYWNAEYCIWDIKWVQGDYNTINDKCGTELDDGEYEPFFGTFFEEFDETVYRGEYDIIGNTHDQ